jgi:hypothetical protein
MKNNSEIEHLDNAIKISINPHRLFENDIRYYETWAETFISENSTFHYLPLGHDFTPSIFVHERTHLVDNDLTRFKFMAFIRDFVSELPNLDFSEEILSFCEHNIEFFNIIKLNNFLNYEWRKIIEASACVEQLQSFFTPDILASAIIDELKLRKKEILVLISKIVDITDRILQRISKPSGWGKEDQIVWINHMRNILEEWKWAKRHQTSIHGMDEEKLIIRTMRSIIRENIVKAILSVTATQWDYNSRYPRLCDALNYLHQLSETEIPKWSSPLQNFDFLVHELEVIFNIDRHEYLLSYLRDSFLLFYIFLELIQDSTYDEILKKYFYALLSLIIQPVIPNCNFPYIWYFCKTKEHKESVIITCSELFYPVQPIRISSITHWIGRISYIQMKACRRLLVIRNNLLKKCKGSCIGQKDCPLKNEFYFQVKNSWKPLLKDVKDFIHSFDFSL